MSTYDVAIIGAGSWGTAVALHLARNQQKVALWGRNKQHMSELQKARCNQAYLPDFSFPDTLSIEIDFSHAVNSAKHLIIAVPSHAFSEIINLLPKNIHALSWLTKGIEPKTHALLHEVVLAKFPHCQFAVISGPSFAKEVAGNLPTAITLASNNAAYAKTLHKILHQQNFRVYFSTDYIGVEVAGAVKNVLAIAVGISDGLGFGANARAALITRGLKEMSRLAMALGARESTFMGLAALGDLLLTATDNQSRNRRFGLQLGQGQTPEHAAAEIGQVVEGRFNASQVCELAKNNQLELPICETVNAILKGELAVNQAVETLLVRPASYE